VDGGRGLRRVALLLAWRHPKNAIALGSERQDFNQGQLLPIHTTTASPPPLLVSPRNLNLHFPPASATLVARDPTPLFALRYVVASPRDSWRLTRMCLGLDS